MKIYKGLNSTINNHQYIITKNHQLGKINCLEGTKIFVIHSDCEGYWSSYQCEMMMEAYGLIKPYMIDNDLPKGVSTHDLEKLDELLDLIRYCAGNGIGYVIQFA
jgi:hypothetical protein